MNSLWTPSGEYQPEDSNKPDSTEPTGPDSQTAGTQPTEGDPFDKFDPENLTDEQKEALAQLAAVREQVANTPASAIVANHAVGLYELAMLHLSLAAQPGEPPEGRKDRIRQAQIGIDAFSGLLGACKGRLGEEEKALTDALAQLQLTFVQVKDSIGE